MVKSNEMASEALKKSNDLYKANIEIIGEKPVKLPKPDPNLIQYDLTK